MNIQSLGEMVPPSNRNTLEICSQITLLILNDVSSRLVALLKVIDAPIQVPNIFDLTVIFNFLNFSFQICILFVPEMPSSFTSYIVRLSTLLWILYPLHFSLLSLI